MFHFSIAPSDYLAPSFENKLNMCDRTGCQFVEIKDTIQGVFLGAMDGDTIEEMRSLLIDYGKQISLVTYTGSAADRDRFKKLLRTAHLLGVKAIAVGYEGYETIDDFRADLEVLAKYAECYGIDVCVENRHDTILAKNKDLETLIKSANEKLGVVFNPMSFAYMQSHPFFHEFYASKLKNNVLVLRVNDGLFCDRIPALPGRGNAEIKELASILLSRSFDGYFSFTDYVGEMCWADIMEYVTTFKTLLKQM